MNYIEIISYVSVAGLGSALAFGVDKFFDLKTFSHAVKKDKFELKFTSYADWLSESRYVISALFDSTFEAATQTIDEDVMSARLKRNELYKISSRVVLSVPQKKRKIVQEQFDLFFANYKKLLEKKFEFRNAIQRSGHAHPQSIFNGIIELQKVLQTVNDEIVELLYQDIDL